MVPGLDIGVDLDIGIDSFCMWGAGHEACAHLKALRGLQARGPPRRIFVHYRLAAVETEGWKRELKTHALQLDIED